jgi:hypothetical protein
MEAIFLVCGAGGPQLKRNPLGCRERNCPMSSDLTLDDMEGPSWADPDFPSPMVQRIRALGRVPLREFTADDFRLIITQQRALGTLIPLALDLLQEQPLLEATYYPGDLLNAVATVDDNFWLAHSELRARAKRILAGAIAQLDTLEEDDREETELVLRAAYESL